MPRSFKVSGSADAGTSGIILIMCLLGGISGFVSNRSKAEDRQKMQTQLREFALHKSPALLEKLDALHLSQGELAARVKTLGRELKALGREPEADNDYRTWKQALTKCDEAVSRLEEKIADAYLVHRKYLLSPDPDAEYKVSRLLGEGLRGAERLESELSLLQENIITENGRKIPVRRAVLAKCSE